MRTLAIVFVILSALFALGGGAVAHAGASEIADGLKGCGVVCVCTALLFWIGAPSPGGRV